MPKGYWIVRVDITDMEKYRAYIAADAKLRSTADLIVIEGYDGRQPS